MPRKPKTLACSGCNRTPCVCQTVYRYVGLFRVWRRDGREDRVIRCCRALSLAEARDRLLRQTEGEDRVLLTLTQLSLKGRKV